MSEIQTNMGRESRLYRGIVYARYKRFERAVEQEFTPGEYNEYGCVCPQDPEHLLRQVGNETDLRFEEGELCLSIAVPGSAFSSAPLLPVMVWIHGGSYLTGGSEDHRYDALPLAEAGGVVVVKISYRLGALGYLYNKEKGVANLGLDDQKTALRWIQKHISAFGGDPSNVTLWGQSAGAHSVASLIATASPTERLFSRAILQSAPLGVKMSEKTADKLCGEFLHRLTERLCGDVERVGEARSQAWELARTAPIEDIVAVQTSMKGEHLGMPFMPVLPDNMLVTNVSKPLDVLLYYNKEDASPYSRKALGNKLFRSPLGSLLTRIITDYVFRLPAQRYLKRLRGAGIKASLCRFSWSPKGSALRCCHSIELPFLLGHPDDWGSAEMLQGVTDEEFRHYSRIFKTLWSDFARSGEVVLKFTGKERLTKKR